MAKMKETMVKKTSVSFVRETRLEAKACLRCGTQFTGATVSRYCSKACRNAANYARHSEQYRKEKLLKYHQAKKQTKPRLISFNIPVRKVTKPGLISFDTPVRKVTKPGPISFDISVRKVTKPGPVTMEVLQRKVTKPGPVTFQVRQRKEQTAPRTKKIKLLSEQ